MHSQSSSLSIWFGFRTMENNASSIVFFFFLSCKYVTEHEI